MFYTIDNCGSVGVVKDAYPHELQDSAWSDARNVRFREGYAEKFKGHTDSFGTTSASALWVQPITVGTARDWIYTTQAKVYYVNPAGTHTDISGYSYNANYADGWTGGVLGGIAVMSNGVNTPQYWAGTGNAANLTNWPTSHSATCKVMRAHKSYLVALNVSETSATASQTHTYPHMVWWSQPAEPGSLPTTWDYSSASNDSGRNDLAEDPTHLVDGLTMGERFICYKEGSYWAMDYIGPPYIWRFSKISSVNGALAKNCVTPVGSGNHAVFGNGDIYVHSGGDPTSVVNAKLRRWIYSQIDTSNYDRSFAVTNPLQDEAWFCFPPAGASWCTTAAVWNYRDNTTTIRDIPTLAHAASGIVDAGLANSWNSASGSWDASDAVWNSTGITESSPRLILVDHANKKTFVADQTKQFNNVSFTAYVERTGLSCGDPTRVKLLKSVRPIFDAPAGTEITVRMGAAMDIQSATTWNSPQTYTVGTSLKIDGFARGRFLAIRFESTGSVNWRLKRYDLEVEGFGLW